MAHKAIVTPYNSGWRIRHVETFSKAGKVTKLRAVVPVATPISSNKSGILELLRGLLASGSSSASFFQTLTSKAASTPPIVYFLALILAGFGVPISEDALCIFAGTLLPTLAGNTRRQIELVTCLYLGIVLSDFITFGIGRLLRIGVLEPIRKKYFSDLDQQAASSFVSGEIGAADATTPPKRMRKRDRIKQKFEKSGDYIGFVIRLSVGMRPALMLLSGFSGKISFVKYMAGTFFGAIVSLSAQLAVGYGMKSRPGLVARGIASASTFAIVTPAIIVVASWLGILISKRRKDLK